MEGFLVIGGEPFAEKGGLVNELAEKWVSECENKGEAAIAAIGMADRQRTGRNPLRHAKPPSDKI